MTQRTTASRLIAALTGLTLLATACGSDRSGGAQPSPTTVAGSATSTSTTTTVAEPGLDGAGAVGWIDGEPDWGAVGAEGGERESRAVAADSASTEAAADLDGAMPVEPDGGIGGGATPPIGRPADTTPLRAGSVDDNADFDGFLAYLERIAGIGVTTRDMDPAGRSVITVVDDAGRPVPGEVVEVSAGAPGGPLIRIRTTADGTARFHPGFYGLPTDGVAEFGLASTDMELIPAAAGDDITIVTRRAEIASPVPLDVLFLLDATGSMGDEIGRLKQTIDTVAERVTALDPAPDVRFAMTLYRDEGDAFVTANYDFTGDITEFQAALADVVADGGGDYPEALDEGLADALAKPAWRDPASTVQLVFVVADAPPQVARQVATPYTDSVRAAIERGIKIFPVASSESDDQAEAVFRQLAQATGAPFVFLSNGAAGAATGGATDIDSTDYEELALDELVVRLIAEELSDLGGGQDGVTVTIPTTVAPPATNPEGQ